MGKQDISINSCLQDPVRYADCFNTALGKCLIRPDQLLNLERIEEGNIAFPRTVVYYKKERDNIRGIQNSSNILCAIVCIENQTDIHYAEVVRHFIYDAYSYNKQLTDIRKKHENETSGSHYRYQGFSPDDRLMPVITVCIYYGNTAWNAATDLIELMDFSGFTEQEMEAWKPYIQNYKLIVLDIRRMTEKQLESMESDLKLLFGMLKYAEDKEHLYNFINKYAQDMDHLRFDLAEAFSVLSGTKEFNRYIQQDTEGDTISMCKAIDDMLQDSRAEGIAEGRIEGKAEGIAEGRIEGKAEGIRELAKTLLMQGRSTIEDIVAATGLSTEEVEQLCKI